MACIRRKYHGGVVYLCPEIKNGKYPLCGQTVPVVRKKEWSNISFLGFSIIDDIALYGGAIITGITGFTTGDQYFGKWIDIHVDAWLLASVENNGVKLVVYKGQPIIIGDHGLPEDNIKYENNVFKM